MKSFIILFIVTSHAILGGAGTPTGVWLEELTTPYYMLKDAGYEVQITSIDGGTIPIDPRSMSNVPDDNPASVKRFLKDAQAMAALQNSPSIKTINTEKYAAAFIPGGHGAMFDMPENEHLSNILSTMWQQNKVIAAICHGPAALVNVVDANGKPIVKGRSIATFSNAEEDELGLRDVMPFMLETKLRSLGATIKRDDKFQPYSVTDGNLITGQNPASSAEVAQRIIDALPAVETIKK